MSDQQVPKTPHNWVNSPYGHGEWACVYCKATNREIAVIGDPNHCPDAPRSKEERGCLTSEPS